MTQTAYLRSGAGVASVPRATSARYPLIVKSRALLLLPNVADGYRDFYVFPEQIINADGTHYLVYACQGATSYAFGLARFDVWPPVSAASLTDLGNQIVGVDSPHIIRDGATWHLFGSDFGANTGIKRWTSSSILGPWSVQNGGAPVIAAGAGGTWDNYRAAEPFVIAKPDASGFLCFYMGYNTDGSPDTEQIGVAEAATLAGAWTKSANNPIIPMGTGTPDFDNSICADPFVVYWEGLYYIFYSGCSGALAYGHGQCCLATAADPMAGTVTKRGIAGKAGIVFPWGVWPAADSSTVWRGSFYWPDGDTIYYPYAARKHNTQAAAPANYVQGYLATIDPASFRSAPIDSPWRRVETNATDPRLTISGGWTNSAVSQASNGRYHFSNTTGNTITFTFEGRRCLVGAHTKNNMGIMGVTVDGGAEQLVDLYAPDGGTGLSMITAFDTGELAYDEHTIVLRVTGTKHAASSDFYGNADYFDYC